MPFFVVVVSSSFSAKINLLNIKVQYTRVNQHRHTECAHASYAQCGLYCVRVELFFRWCFSWKCFRYFPWENFFSLSRPFQSLAADIFSPTRAFNTNAKLICFSVNRKFFTLTYPMLVCRFPRDDLFFVCFLSLSLSLFLAPLVVENVCS